MVEATTATSPLSAATANPETPPLRESTSRASPPPGGRAHSDGFGSPFFSAGAAGSGRAEVNNNEPSGPHVGEDSPGALRVSRCAGRRPAGSTSHRADTH